MKQGTAMALGLLMAGAASLAGAGVTGTGEDDLAIVKKAVASPPPAVRAARTTAKRDEVVAVAQVTPPPVAEAIPVVRSGREPKWFKVRVVERGTGRKKVTVNLPLSLVRALGDDAIDWGCRGDGDGRRQCHTVRLSEVLRSLEAGQDLVEVEDENAVVKVWVE